MNYIEIKKDLNSNKHLLRKEYLKENIIQYKYDNKGNLLLINKK